MSNDKNKSGIEVSFDMEQMVNFGGGLSVIDGVDVKTTAKQVIMYISKAKLIDPEAPEPLRHTQLLYTEGQARNYVAITGARGNLEGVKKKTTRLLEIYDQFLRNHGRILDKNVITEIGNDPALEMVKTFRWPVSDVVHASEKARKPGDGQSDLPGGGSAARKLLLQRLDRHEKIYEENYQALMEQVMQSLEMLLSDYPEEAVLLNETIVEFFYPEKSTASNDVSFQSPDPNTSGGASASSGSGRPTNLKLKNELKNGEIDRRIKKEWTLTS